MNDDTFTSGFIGETTPPVDVAFTDIQEIYTSRSGWNCLFRCHRYGKLHVLKALQPMYEGTVFYEQALKKNSISAINWNILIFAVHWDGRVYRL